MSSAAKKIPFNQCKAVLMAPTRNVVEKFTAVLNVKYYDKHEATKALEEGFPYMGQSQFLRHEALFWMGQLGSHHSLPFLLSRLHDPEENSIVRHEAAAAIANVHAFKDQMIPELEKHLSASDPIFQRTIVIALAKLKSLHAKSRYALKGFIEAAEPFDEAEIKEYCRQRNLPIPKNYGEVLELVHQEMTKSYDEVDEYSKYRFMYFLRDMNDQRSKQILSDVISVRHMDVTTAVFRHELAASLGQLNDGEDFIYDSLRECLLNEEEHPVARHEAILALKDITENPELIAHFKDHNDQMLRESVEIATLGTIIKQYVS